MKNVVHLAVIFGILSFTACFTSQKTSETPHKPTNGKPQAGRPGQVDTIRWTQQQGGKPPIGAPGKETGKPEKGETYHISYLLPFLTDQFAGTAVPEKSRLALQFYTGAKLALEDLSTTQHINFVVDVWDTQANDADFQQLINNSKLQKSSVFIGPVRSAHVEKFASWARQHNKIVISPETPNAGLASANPDFLQFNPSLQSHCEAITAYVMQRHKPEVVTLVCKQKEAERLTYFQESSARKGAVRFNEVLVPDAALNFDNVDLKRYIKAGKTSVFIMPSWASQDFVMAFLRKLKEIKGSASVEVYGMPQWENFESIEPDYLNSLHVHISKAAWVDYSSAEVKAFQQRFFEASGTIPDEDGFNGYDVTWFTGKMLGLYGLSFVQRLQEVQLKGFRGNIQFKPVYVNGGDGGVDYYENGFVHILRFDNLGYVPVVND